MIKEFIVLDTETTGFHYNDEVIQISIINQDGMVLFNRMIQPIHAKIHPEATKIHGIDDAMVATVPTLRESWDELERLMKGVFVVAYNVEFDSRMVKQSCQIAGLPDLSVMAEKWHCAMLAYAKHARVPRWRNSNQYRWHKLAVAAERERIVFDETKLHDALADVQLTLELIKKLRADGVDLLRL